MHLLAGETGTIEDGGGAVDLDQPPGDIVFLSAADSELAALARVAASREGPSLRLANLARLIHPLSVDLYAEKTLRHARLVVVRMMGGAGYWPYGLDTLRALARAGGPALAVIPGDAQWDAALEAFTTVDGEAARRLWRYLVEGGALNVEHAFAFMAHLIGCGALPPEPEVLPRAGYYRPGRGPLAFRDLGLDPDCPAAAIVFYRALLDGASHAPIDALAEALAAEGIAALPVFVASLKDRESEAFLADAFERTPPAIVLNTTSFAVSKLGAAHGGTVLDLPGRPVLQVILAGSSEEAWRASPRGLLPRDLTMNVVLPEVDGRLITRAVSFKADVAEGGFAATIYRPLADRIVFVAAQAAAWIRLAAKPARERRVALVLSNYPDREGRLANGVGLDTPASAVRIAAAMAGAGYSVEGFPDSSAALMGLLTAEGAITSPRWGEVVSPAPAGRAGEGASPSPLAGEGRGGGSGAAEGEPPSLTLPRKGGGDGGALVGGVANSITTTAIPAKAGIHRPAASVGRDAAGTEAGAINPGFRRDDQAEEKGASPSPLAGEGRGGGSGAAEDEPPSLTLPRKGGGDGGALVGGVGDSIPTTVIPAKAGIHRPAASVGRDAAGTEAGAINPGFRRDDQAEEKGASPSPLAGEGRGGGLAGDAVLPLAAYRAFLATLPPSLRDALAARWGRPEADPHFADGAFRIRAHRFGNVVVGIQPARGYGVDPKATFHDPALVPPHHYLAFYAWLRTAFGADAVVQVGKHGNLEWLPGKALGLSAECWPEVTLGPTPLIYPFIVNDPGEGSQAKRRSAAVIIDHLMPAMTRAETHGGLAELETLIDEYYVAAGIDERRRAWLEGEILAAAERTGIAADLGLVRTDKAGTLQAIDAHLCDIKELQIRDGLHILGEGPAGRQRIDTLAAIARVPRSGSRPEDGSLQRAIAEDLALGFDPLAAEPASPWTGPRPAILAALSDAPWRSAGDTVERIEMLAARLVERTVGEKSGVGSKGAITSPRWGEVVSPASAGRAGEGASSSEGLALPLASRPRRDEGSVGGSLDTLPPHPAPLARFAPKRRGPLPTGERGAPNADDGSIAQGRSGRIPPSAITSPRWGEVVSPASAGRAGEGAPAQPPPSAEASLLSVIPAKAGIHRSGASTEHDESGTGAEAKDPGFRRDDGEVEDRTDAVLAWITATLAPALNRSGGDEIAAVLAALDGRFVPPGPSGAPTRGRPDVLPTGRNFYSVDVRAVPTAAAWAVGRAAADAMALRYFQDEGEWPRSVALSAWSTSNMRTGGDDVAQALALIGTMPEWEKGTGRVTGFRILPLAELGRPRIDVTLKISGMFRDAFPGQIDLLDSAIRAVAALSEDETANPIAASVREEMSRLRTMPEELARRRATARIFGSRPGAYGTGLQALMDGDLWEDRSDLVGAFMQWGAHAYGGPRQGEADSDAFHARLKGVQAVIQPQDTREHDILDSDEYWQFAGGLAASVEAAAGISPRLYHADTSSPERPRIRSLGEEIGRVVRGRAANPKWLSGMMRHGYKGASEMAATVDYLYAFAATTDAVGDHHFDALYQAFIGNPEVLGFLRGANPAALREMGDKFRRAIERGLWSPRINSAYDRLSALINEPSEAAE